MEVEHIASFSVSNELGGNPAGVVLCDVLPDEKEMQRVAGEVGYSETVFSCPENGKWRTRYFSPINEVPFCGHATIALGAVLAANFGSAVYPLQLNGPEISVEGSVEGDALKATLVSPPSKSSTADGEWLARAIDLFGLTDSDLNPAIPPIIAEAGARHLVLALKSRERLSAIDYDLTAGKAIMDEKGLITILLVYIENDQLFHVRNAFASGGVFEDPATGAAAAAFGGYLNKIGWPHNGKIQILQGEDMGMPSEITVEITGEVGSPLQVSGMARRMQV